MIKTSIKILATNNIEVKNIMSILKQEGLVAWSNFEAVPSEIYNVYFILHDNTRIEMGYGESYHKCEYEEIDADLFIRTNGTCEEMPEEAIYKIKSAFQGKSAEYLQDKIINLHKQINKDKVKIKNQKEELTKLTIRLQKSISLEEHNSKTEKLRDTIVSLRDEVINKADRMRDDKNKEIEKLKAIIEYLEGKLK